MPTEDNFFLLNQTAELRQVHHITLKNLLKTLNTLITLHQARNSFPPTIQMQLDIKINKLNTELNKLEKLNKKIQTQLLRMEKTFHQTTTHKILVKQN